MVVKLGWRRYNVALKFHFNSLDTPGGRVGYPHTLPGNGLPLHIEEDRLS